MMFTSCEFDVSYGVVRGLEFGSGRALRILAVHGWLDNAASFVPIAPLVEDAHIVALDLAGHGHSDHRPAGVNYHLVDYVPDILEVAGLLEWEEFILLGHSLGAGLACLAASSFPERVKKLVLIDGIGPISGAERDGPARLRRSVQMRSRPVGKRRTIHPDVDSAVAARLRATTMDPRCARLIVERNLMAVEDGYTWRTDRKATFASPLYLAESQVHAFLRAIVAPTLLVRAERGVIASRESTEGRIDCLQSAVVHDVAGDHHVHMDHPQVVAPLINAFLAS